MALDKARLASKIKAAFLAEQVETEDYMASVDRLSEAIAAAVVDEILAVTITYSAGLTASTFPVVGAFNNVIS